ncbi:HNH endonuclease [Roseomonas chloroacetimidivorans]|uniref:HNH endonuclease n=1 Tax=Roseomonas chloroacetimidivorans TaxID=1766656 RepID=UPI003C77D91A
MAKPKRAVLAFMPSPPGTLGTRSARPPPKQAGPHYQTLEHQRWRAEVTRRAGGMYQASRSGRSGVRLFADQIIQMKDGGAPFDPTNGQALCGPATWPGRRVPGQPDRPDPYYPTGQRRRRWRPV